MTHHGIILIDGCDGCGKSWLAKALRIYAEQQGTKAVIHHLGKPESGTAWRLNVMTLEQAIQEAFVEGKLVILDRHFISELVYGAVYRGSSEFPHAARHLDRLLHRFRALRVICAPPVDVVLENHARLSKVRHEEYDTDSMREVAQAYLDLWHGCPKKVPYELDDYRVQLTTGGGVADTAGWYKYDLTVEGQDIEAYCKFLLNELLVEQQLMPVELQPVSLPFTGFPHQNAWLFVGDRLAQQAAGENPLRIPFLSDKNSSRFLAETLAHLNLDESRVVMVNANGVDRHWLAELVARCGRTILLGREAERVFLQENLPYDARVRHPQHARRFDGGSPATYAAEIGAVL